MWIAPDGSTVAGNRVGFVLTADGYKPYPLITPVAVVQEPQVPSESRFYGTPYVPPPLPMYQDANGMMVNPNPGYENTNPGTQTISPNAANIIEFNRNLGGASTPAWLQANQLALLAASEKGIDLNTVDLLSPPDQTPSDKANTENTELFKALPLLMGALALVFLIKRK